MASKMNYRIEEYQEHASLGIVARFSERTIAEVCLTRLADCFDKSYYILMDNAGNELQREYGIAAKR